MAATPDLVDGPREIRPHGAADAALGQLDDIDGDIRQEVSIDPHLPKLVFEDDDGPLDAARQLTDERGLARAQKSRYDENLHQTPLSPPCRLRLIYVPYEPGTAVSPPPAENQKSALEGRFRRYVHRSYI